jgi:DNA-binding GntR family transcriptional regulator
LIAEHLRTHSLVDLAYKAIKKDINSRKLLPGQKIIVRELAKRYGTSETPIKQALNRLVTEGLVETFLRRGMRVKEMAWDWVEESLEARRMIETFCAKQAIIVARSDHKIKKQFEKNIKSHARILADASDMTSYFEHSQLDYEFHRILVNCSGNKKIIEMYRNLGSHLYMNYIYGVQKESRIVEGFEEHKAIWNALKDQDLPLLIESIDKHILNGKANMRAIFEEIQKPLECDNPS